MSIVDGAHEPRVALKGFVGETEIFERKKCDRVTKLLDHGGDELILSGCYAVGVEGKGVVVVGDDELSQKRPRRRFRSGVKGLNLEEKEEDEANGGEIDEREFREADQREMLVLSCVFCGCGTEDSAAWLSML